MAVVEDGIVEVEVIVGNLVEAEVGEQEAKAARQRESDREDPTELLRAKHNTQRHTN